MPGIAGKFTQSAQGRRPWPGALRRVGVARAAGGGDRNRSDPEIGAMARGRLDAGFHRDARMASAATPQSRRAMTRASPPSTDDADPHDIGQRRQPRAIAGFAGIGRGIERKFQHKQQRHWLRQCHTWHCLKIQLLVVNRSWSVSVKRFESLCRLIPAQFRSQCPGNAGRDSAPTEKE